MANIYMTEDVKNFQCQSSGDCCRINWRVNVEDDVFNKLICYFRTHDTDFKDKNLFIQFKDADKEKHGLYFTEKGCVFLEENNLCYIHRAIDKNDKPRICKQFPNVFFSTPYGIFTSLSYACPTSAGCLADGKPFRIITSPSSAQQPCNTILDIDENISMPWDVFSLFEKNLMEVLGMAGIPLQTKLMRGAAFINRVSDISKKNNRITLDLMKEISNDIKARGGWGCLDEEFINFRVLYSQQVKLLISLLTLWKKIFTCPGGEKDELLGERIDYIFDQFNIGNKTPGKKPSSLIYTRSIKEYYAPHTKKIEKIIERFVLSKIFGKKIFSYSNIKRGYLTLLTVLGILRMYYLSCSIEKGEAAGTGDLIKGIMFVERYFIHSPKLASKWKKVDKAGLFQNPDYPYLVTKITP